MESQRCYCDMVIQAWSYQHLDEFFILFYVIEAARLFARIHGFFKSVHTDPKHRVGHIVEAPYIDLVYQTASEIVTYDPCSLGLHALCVISYPEQIYHCYDKNLLKPVCLFQKEDERHVELSHMVKSSLNQLTPRLSTES